MQKLLCAVYFLAHGTTYSELSDAVLVPHYFLFSIVQPIIKLIADLHSEFITFPEGVENIRKMEAGFHKKFQFPTSIGVIDGTFIKISKPPGMLFFKIINFF